MDFLGARIQLNPRSRPRPGAVLETGMVGHCPGRVRLERLKALPGILTEIRRAGFDWRVDEFEQQSTADLYDLPLPLHSSAEFDDIFPDARTESAVYGSLLAGKTAWLPQAVDDFFANGGQKLWLVRVREEEGVRGFIPEDTQLLHEPRQLRGVGCLLAINALGLIALPDLERLQIPAQLPDIRRNRLANPEPRFLPLGASIGDDHRERRYSSELAKQPLPIAFSDLLQRLMGLVARVRPDIQCLFSVPLSYSAQMDSPDIDYLALDSLLELRAQHGNSYRLRQTQLLFPYLRDPQERIFSPAGVIAGAMAATAEQGVWRSIGGKPLVSQGQPFPLLDTQRTIALREDPGIGILNRKSGRLSLDDERLVVPALHPDDYPAGGNSEKLRATRSGEVVRFLGYIKRELQILGDHLVFNLDARDPRPKLVLERFFLGLYRAGALRGAVPEQAFTIRRASTAENVIAFDIEIAPAYPIDKIVITFINRDGEWRTGVSRG